jgi:LCP family protein required for cell wall assembly
MANLSAAAPPRRPWLRFTVITMLLVAGLLAAAVTTLSVEQHRSPVAVVMHAEPVVPDPRALFGKNFVRLLLVGLDYDYDAKDMHTSAHSRSDIIMAIGLDLTKRKLRELSVPRDMVAVLPNGQQAKINQAQSDGGIVESQAVVAQWLGIPSFDRYVVLRIDTTKDLIDAIGGVDFTVQNSDALKHQGPNGPLDYDDSWGHLHVHLKSGYQHLNGESAVGYARFRHDWCSDPCRILRQQQVMRAIVDRLKSNKLNTLLHIGALVNVMHNDVQTNLTTQEELSLAYAFRDASTADIKAAQVPYVRSIDLPGYGDSIVADDEKKAQLVHDMLIDP